ncbi:hypothetical protein IQ07DRAFT_593050 [Pyrenochaeta sp. DS3sAY3a]|nr:hypothetical protein IQ07DRAFT_593050 [Pyrenochaeta sp. DS3sAY3a]
MYKHRHDLHTSSPTITSTSSLIQTYPIQNDLHDANLTTYHHAHTSTDIHASSSNHTPHHTTRFSDSIIIITVTFPTAVTVAFLKLTTYTGLRSR